MPSSQPRPDIENTVSKRDAANTEVKIEGVSKLYASAEGEPAWGLLDVALSIHAGEFLCAIGPSGCGKTTLLNLIAGFIRPSRGSLLFDGEPIVGPAPNRGVVFQEYALFRGSPHAAMLSSA